MIKKIIAVALAVVLCALCFTGCTKKPENVDVNGVDKPVAYNENGYAVFDEDGYVRVYETDANGKIQYDENGNPRYNYYNAEDGFVHDGMIDTPLYAFMIPKGWESYSSNTIIKTGTDKKCKIQIFVAYEDGTAVEDFISDNRASNQDVMFQAKNQHPDYTVDMDTEDFTLSSKEMPAYANTYKINDAEGKVIHYAVDLFFLMNGQVYDLNYLCSSGEGYDESFDFISYAKENFIAK